MSSTDPPATTKAQVSSYDQVARAEATRANPTQTGGAGRAAYRAYNNFVKAALLRQVFRPWTGATAPAGLSVLDLASGRGGDLAKALVPARTQTVPVMNYVALDISADSVAEAKRRLEAMRAKIPSGCETLLYVVDVFDTEGAWKTHPALISPAAAAQESSATAEEAAPASGRYHVVTMQFALHYGCSSVERLRAFLRCVASVLVDGGYFCGTTVDEEKLRIYYHNNGENANDDIGGDGAAPFSVTPVVETASVAAGGGAVATATASTTTTTTQQTTPLPIGKAYRFRLDELVDDVEYSIPWPVLRDEAAAVGLEVATELDMNKNLFDGFRGGYMPQGDIRPELTAADVSLVSFYLSFCFVKKRRGTS